MGEHPGEVSEPEIRKLNGDDRDPTIHKGATCIGRLAPLPEIRNPLIARFGRRRWCIPVLKIGPNYALFFQSQSLAERGVAKTDIPDYTPHQFGGFIRRAYRLQLSPYCRYQIGIAVAFPLTTSTGPLATTCWMLRKIFDLAGYHENPPPPPSGGRRGQGIPAVKGDANGWPAGQQF